MSSPSDIPQNNHTRRKKVAYLRSTAIVTKLYKTQTIGQIHAKLKESLHLLYLSTPETETADQFTITRHSDSRVVKPTVLTNQNIQSPSLNVITTNFWKNHQTRNPHKCREVSHGVIYSIERLAVIYLCFLL